MPCFEARINQRGLGFQLRAGRGMRSSKFVRGSVRFRAWGLRLVLDLDLGRCGLTARDPFMTALPDTDPYQKSCSSCFERPSTRIQRGPFREIGSLAKSKKGTKGSASAKPVRPKPTNPKAHG